MNDEQKKINFIDSTYKLPELIDNLDAANANANIIITQQEYLVKLASKDKRSEEILVGFADSVNQQLANMKAKVHINEYRKECLNMLMSVAKDVVAVRFAVSMMLEAMGIVNPEALPYDKRPELAIEKEVEEAVKEEEQTEKKDA